MINFLKKKFNKNLKHGTLFFQFPNGEKLYLLNESEFESIQSMDCWNDDVIKHENNQIEHTSSKRISGD